MTSKSARIAALIESHRGHRLDAHYLGFFDCFNRRLYYEAHEVLEELWLADRTGPNGPFYKGLIQLAGAFVHLRKSRPGPAAALFRLAERNLENYGPVHERLDVRRTLGLIRGWLSEPPAAEVGGSPASCRHPPNLELLVSLTETDG
jgi:uncharacterized protein